MEKGSKMLQTIIKVAVSVAIILFCTAIGKKLPSLAGLIAVMPLTGLIVLIFLYYESSANPHTMISYTKGALWGIAPSILFFLVAFFCFKKQLSLPIILAASFTVWLAAAALHQYLLK